MATLRIAAPDVLGALCTQTLVTLQNFGPTDVANVAWAFQVLSYRDEDFFRGLREASLAQIRNFNAQDVANTAWVLASQKCREQRLLHALGHCCVEQTEFRPLHLAAVAWTYGTLKFSDATFLADISAKSLPLILRGDFDAHSIASIAWAFATLVYHEVHVFEAIGAVGRQGWRPQDLANVAWAFAVVAVPVPMAEVAVESLRKLPDFRQEEVEMLLWALAPSQLDMAMEILKATDRLGLLRPLGLSPILAEAERRGEPGLGMDLLLTLKACAYFRSYSQGLAVRRGFKSQLDGKAETYLQEASASSVTKSKPILALEYVLQHAVQGSPEEVLKSLENFALKVLRPQRQWFKIAAGDKATVVERALQCAPDGACLELGTYVGYTAIRCALRRPTSKVVSIEVDPEHAVLSQCLAIHAGVDHQVRVWTGQSGDVLRSLRDRYGESDAEFPRFAMVFMDQCGSRFWSDLEVLIKQELLMPGAILLADNVLKPGAPLFLWQLFHGLGRDVFTSHLISLEEFAMPGVEDCMLMARYHPSTSQPGKMAMPPEVQALEFEASCIRTRAAEPGGVPFEEWSAHGERMKRALEDLNIRIGEDLSSADCAKAGREKSK